MLRKPRQASRSWDAVPVPAFNDHRDHSLADVPRVMPVRHHEATSHGLSERLHPDVAGSPPETVESASGVLCGTIAGLASGLDDGGLDEISCTAPLTRTHHE